jgi:hypothetical protein
MKSKGIRIYDSVNNIISTKLSDILSEIKNANSLNWAILFSDVTPSPNEGKFIIELEKKINKQEKPYEIKWADLISFANKIYQEIDLIIIGCEDKNTLKKYEDEDEMYNVCDIAIQMLDSSYWEIFSKDLELITKLASKFKNIKLLDPDFER